MRAAIRATALLSGTSAIVIATGIVATKARAELLGPAGIGQMVLLQTICTLTILVFGLGLSGSLPRFLAPAIESDDDTSVAGVRRAVFRLRIISIALAVGILIALRAQIAHFVLKDDSAQVAVVVVGVAAGVGLAMDLQQGLLLAYHRVRATASLSVVGAIGGAVASVAIVAAFRRGGIAASILSITMVSALSTTLVVRRVIPRASAVDRVKAKRSGTTRALLGFGASYTASQLVGGGIALLVPILVLDLFGVVQVAYYQAAVSIGGTYLGFLINAMVTDYYPRVSAARSKPAQLRRLMEDQQRLVVLISVPILVLTLTLVRLVIPIVYTRQFLPAAGVLDWLLVGDLFKFASWTISFVILARARPRVFLLLELFGGASYAAFSYFGARIFGLQGLGVAWLLSYGLYLIACLFIVGRDLGSPWTRANLILLGGGFAIVLTVPAAAFVWGNTGRLAVGLPVFLVSAGYSTWCLSREYRGISRAAVDADEDEVRGGPDFGPPGLDNGPIPGRS